MQPIRREYQIMSWKSALSGVTLAAVLAASVSLPSLMSNAHAHSGQVFAAGEPGDPSKPSRPIMIAFRDGPGTMTYGPDKIEVRVGEQVKLILKNIGHLDHEFLLDSLENNAKHKLEMQKNPEMEHDDPNGKRVKSDQSVELLWRFTKKGIFEFACLIPGHYESGMKGIVVVK
jgi:uncharacterized cupredoxin-like copper-binding protein